MTTIARILCAIDLEKASERAFDRALDLAVISEARQCGEPKSAFDRMFLDLMLEHHQDALTMTSTAKLVMPGVQEFRRRVIATFRDRAQGDAASALVQAPRLERFGVLS